MNGLDSARDKWKSAAVEAETGQAPRGGPSEAPVDGREGTAEPSEPSAPTETLEVTRERVRRLLAVSDAVARQALDLPEREGVDVDLSDADSLDMAAELIAPWAHEHGGQLSPGVQASFGAALLAGELLMDGGYEALVERIDAATQGEPSDALDELPDKDDEF